MPNLAQGFLKRRAKKSLYGRPFNTLKSFELKTLQETIGIEQQILNRKYLWI